MPRHLLSLLRVCNKVQNVCGKDPSLWLHRIYLRYGDVRSSRHGWFKLSGLNALIQRDTAASDTDKVLILQELTLLRMIALNPGRLQLNDRNSPLITLLILIGLSTEVSVKAGSPFDDGPLWQLHPF